jgi:hypothetical protein
MAWGWIKKVKEFGSKAINKAGSIISAGKRALTSGRQMLDKYASPELSRKGNNWLDKAESYLGRAETSVNRFRGPIQPRYREDDDFE